MPHSSTPLEVAKAFLAAIKVRDTTYMQSLCQPGATACLVREGQPQYLLITDILDRLIDNGPEEEMDEVSYDEVEHVDADFATVWTPFRFWINGKLHHTGTNNFTMWKCPDRGWTIIAVQDINRNEEGVVDEGPKYWKGSTGEETRYSL